MQPACTLYDQIDGSHIGDHQVKVQVEALLDDLRGDHDRLARAVSLLAEARENPLLDLIPPRKGKASVEKRQILFWHDGCLSERPVYVLCASHGIADHGCAAPLTQLVCQQAEDCLWLPCYPSDPYASTGRGSQGHHA